jgi:hypothetical protein
MSCLDQLETGAVFTPARAGPGLSAVDLNASPMMHSVSSRCGNIWGSNVRRACQRKFNQRGTAQPLGRSQMIPPLRRRTDRFHFQQSRSKDSALRHGVLLPLFWHCFTTDQLRNRRGMPCLCSFGCGQRPRCVSVVKLAILPGAGAGRVRHIYGSKPAATLVSPPEGSVTWLPGWTATAAGSTSSNPTSAPSLPTPSGRAVSLRHPGPSAIGCE